MKQVYIDTIVRRLKTISTLDFGGKSSGRYKISYKRMQQITGKTILNENFIELLSDHCLMYGISIINLGSEFAIIETGILNGYRNTPQGIVDKIIKDVTDD